MNSRSLGYHRQTGRRVSTRPENAPSITSAPWRVTADGRKDVFCQYLAEAKAVAERTGGTITDDKARSGAKQRKS